MRQAVIQKAEEKQRRQQPNLTGIPTQMKLDFERRSGLSFDDVRVHYNSDKPRKIGALAYTQIPQVHIGPGQERHLRHELGHVVQQKTMNIVSNTSSVGYEINNDPKLEEHADSIFKHSIKANPVTPRPVIQGKFADNLTVQKIMEHLTANYQILPVIQTVIKGELERLEIESEEYDLTAVVDNIKKMYKLSPKQTMTSGPYRYAKSKVEHSEEDLKIALQKVYQDRKDVTRFKPTKSEIFQAIAGLYTRECISDVLKSETFAKRLQDVIRSIVTESPRFRELLIRDGFNFYNRTEILLLSDPTADASMPSDKEIFDNTPDCLQIEHFTLRHYTKNKDPKYSEILSALSLENQHIETSSGGHTEHTDWNTFGNVGNTFFILMVGNNFVCKQDFIKKCPSYVDIPLNKIRSTMWVSSDWLDMKSISGQAYMGNAQQIHAILLKTVVKEKLSGNLAHLRTLDQKTFTDHLGSLYHNFEVKVMGSVSIPDGVFWQHTPEA